MQKTLVLGANKGLPEIEVFTGQLHFGKYQLMLWDESGDLVIWEKKGKNVDNLPDIHVIGGNVVDSVQDLDKTILDWDIIIASTTAGPAPTATTSSTHWWRW